MTPDHHHVKADQLIQEAELIRQSLAQRQNVTGDSARDMLAELQALAHLAQAHATLAALPPHHEVPTNEVVHRPPS
jgi:hypothetical protein